MQHRNHRSLTTNYARAQGLITARADSDPDVATRTETAVASDLLDASIIDRDAGVRPRCNSEFHDLTPFAATEAFARALHAAMMQFAVQTAGKAPKAGKYDLLFATPVMFKDVWVTRQVVDDLGIPYDYYVQQALAYRNAQGNTRIPRPTQLCAPDVVAHVLRQWAQHQVAADTNTAY